MTELRLHRFRSVAGRAEMERQSREYAGRNLARKFLGLVSKRKRDEEKKRMDLWKAMRDSSVERLAAVIASARTEFGDQLHDLCSDAEGVLQRLLRESRPSGNHRKVTLRERLLLADIEASSQTAVQQSSVPENSNAERNLCTTSSNDSAPDAPPRLHSAVLTLMRPTTTEAQGMITEGGSVSLAESAQQQQNAASGRRLLSALLWEERILDDSDRGWVAFGVSVEAPELINFDHSRSQSVSGDGELNRLELHHHRPSASLSNSTAGSEASARSLLNVSAAAAPPATSSSIVAAGVSETPMRVSLMSLLREAEDGSGFIFMNRQMLDRSLVAPHDSSPAKEGGLVVPDAEQVCCVCMGRQKGAAFIPCGHTFCRNCCRELHLGRGTCPLCNKEIRDVLNLY